MLAPFDRDVLDLLKEEAAEAIQDASKVVRFGVFGRNPFLPEAEQRHNREFLEDEIGDFLAIVQILEERGIVRRAAIDERIVWKRGMIVEHKTLDFSIMPAEPVKEPI